MKKKILIVSRAFYPSNSPRSFRTTELVKEFAKLGHQVTLITPKNNYEHILFEKEYGIVIKDLGSPKLPKIDISKGTIYSKFLKRILQRGLLQLFEYPDIELVSTVIKVLKYEKGYDLMISIAVPHTLHWGIALTRTKDNPIAKIWVADCGDPFMGSTLDSFNKMFYFKYIEKYWCNRADFISVPFSGAKEGYYKEFHNKIKIIPQGLNFEDIKIKKSDYKPNKIPTFAYAGGLIPKNRDPKEFIEYILNLNIDFKFFIFTNNKNLVIPFIEKSNGKIELKNYIPRMDLIHFLSKLDFVLNINNSINTQLPSKLIDLSLTNRPILSINSKNIDKNVIVQFLSNNYENQYKVKNIDQYRIENVCNEFLNITDN